MDAKRTVLRPMTPADLDALLPIQEEGAVTGFADVFPQDRFPFPTGAIRERWLADIADPTIDCFLILDESGDVAGFAATRDNEFLHFGTALSTWGSGLADLAHDAVMDHFRSGGHQRVWLRVFERNGRGRRFYEKRAWFPTGERTRSDFAPNPTLLTYEATVRPVGQQPARVQRVAAYGLASRSDSVLLVRVADSPRGGGGLWMLPGGGIDHGETPEQAVIREFAEETGYDVVVERLLEVGSDHRTLRDGTDYHGVFALYAVSIVGGILRDETDGSTDKVEWVHRSRVGDLTMLGSFREALSRWMPTDAHAT